MVERKPLQQLVPIFLSVGVVAFLLVFAWIGTSDQTMQTHRPPVYLSVQSDSQDPQLQPFMDDLRYRMETHHSYRMVSQEAAAAYVVQVEVQFASEGLRANASVHVGPQGRQPEGTPLGYRKVVQGPTGASLLLSEQLFRLINQEIADAPAR